MTVKVACSADRATVEAPAINVNGSRRGRESGGGDGTEGGAMASCDRAIAVDAAGAVEGPAIDSGGGSMPADGGGLWGTEGASDAGAVGPLSAGRFLEPRGMPQSLRFARGFFSWRADALLRENMNDDGVSASSGVMEDSARESIMTEPSNVAGSIDGALD